MNASENSSTGNDLIVRPRKLSYGIRKVKTLNVWPLSIGDQSALIQRIDEDLRSFFRKADQAIDGEAGEGGVEDDVGTKSSGTSNADFAMFAVKLLRENLKEIVRLVTGEKDSEIDHILAEMTNRQADALIQIVWEENYSDILKNRKGLLGMLLETVASAAN